MPVQQEQTKAKRRRYPVEFKSEALGIAQKAIIGLARKMAIILWRLIMEQRPCRPGSASV